MWPYLAKLAGYTASLALASMFTGAASALLGRFGASILGEGAVTLAAAAASIGLVGWDSVRPAATACPLSSHWQVPQGWAVYGSPWYELMFGGVLGIGFITVVPFVGYYVLLIAVMASGSVTMGVIALAVYGLARALPMLTAPLLMHRRGALRIDPAVRATRQLNGWVGRWPAKAIRLTTALAVICQLVARAF